MRERIVDSGGQGPLDRVSSSSAYVAVEHVTLGYPGAAGRAPVLACLNLDIEVEQGEFLCLVGPSGCGKTTFLEALAGLVPIADGDIRINGVRVRGPGRDRALVFQSPSLFPWRDVYGNVMFGLQAQGRLGAQGRARCESVIELVGLTNAVHRRPRELSGGMKQRVNLARALVTEPPLLLLDEPFSALDAQTRETMQDELVRIWQEFTGDVARTAIFVTHDVREAVLLSDRVAVFSQGPGQIVADIRVDLPRPRSAEIRRSPHFISIEEQILSALYGLSPTKDDPDAGPTRAAREGK